jgi:menaquinone-dependent protoporphyrinogen oxidase
MTKVLILYGTRYGATKEISDEIEKIIKDKGIETESYNLKEVKPKDIPLIDQYDGIIIGTGIKMGMWTKVVKNFIQKRKKEINKKETTFGFYVCCGEANKDIDTAIEKYVSTKLEKIGVKAELYDAFGGAYDLREGSAVTGMTRKIVIGIMKDEEGIENPEGNLYDYRDWDQIRDYARKYAELIQNIN